MARKEYTGKLFQTYLDSDRAWEVIEYKSMGYNRDIDEIYPAHFITETKPEEQLNYLHSVLFKNEKYKIYDGMLNDYVLTSLGRVINIKIQTQLIAYFKSTSLIILIRNNKINLADEFMKYEWPFTIDGIKRTYDKYKWRYTIGLKKFHY